MRMSLFVVPCLVMGSAVAHADDETDVKAHVAKLLDPDLGDDASMVFRAFHTMCGMDCEYWAYSTCKLTPDGPVDCVATVYDGDKKQKPVKVHDAVGKPDALAAARDKLVHALQMIDGGTVDWYQEHDFSAENPDVETGGTKLHWDWKKTTLTISMEGRKPKKVKVPKLPKGLGLVAAEVLFYPMEDGTIDGGFVRTIGEDDYGGRGDSVVKFSVYR